MSEQVLKPIHVTNQSSDLSGEIILQPLEWDEDEKKRRATELFETSDFETLIPNQSNTMVLPENASVAEKNLIPTIVENTVPAKAETVSFSNNMGWKLLGGVMFLGGVGAMVGGGSHGNSHGNNDDSNHSSNHSSDSKQSDLIAPVVSLNPLTNINQANQTQTFTLSGNLKADSTATQNTVSVMIYGKSHLATVSGNTWTLDIAGRDLASQQGKQDIFVTAVSIRGDKTASSKTISGSLNVDTQISTPEVSLNDVPDQLSTQKQMVIISGGLNNVDADATVQVRVKLNNGKEKIATVSGNTWKLELSGNELVSKVGVNNITVTAIATDKSGNTAQHSDSDTFTVYQPTTTKIVYETGKTADVAGSTATTFNMRSLKDSATVSEQTLHSEYKAIYGDAKIATNIQAAFGKDSDNDGVIDRNDKNPNSWDVSERDLRMFATLSYGKEEQLNKLVKAVNSPDDTTSKQVLADFYANDNVNNRNSFNFNGQSKIEEVLKDWEILVFYNDSDMPIISTGLDFTIFGNGKKANGSYENIVVAFRGTTNAADFLSDFKLTLGFIPAQTEHTGVILQYLTKYNPEKIYVTGHSLGGYNGQFFIGDYLFNSEFKEKFVHSAIFNPAILNPHGLSNRRLHNAKDITDNLLKTYYLDDSDKTQAIQKQKTSSYVVEGDFVSEELGWYGYTTWIAEKNAISFTLKNHALISFSQNDAELKELFSKGYRVDKWYVNDDTDKDGLTDVQENHLGTAVKSATVINGTDTDKDGFSDRLEIELGADWTTAQNAVALSADRATHFAVAATKTTDTGAFISAQGIELTAQMNGKTIHYTPNGNAINLGIASNEEWQTWLDAGSKIQSGSNGNDTLSGSHVAQIIYGGSGNDTLTVGSAQTVLIGGSGSDTFKFNASHLTSGKMNIISDLTYIDKLDFSGSKSLFSQSSTFKWSSVLGDTSLLAKNDAALIWQDDNNTLAYKAQDSNELHTFARFDDSQTLATLQATLII